MTRPVAFLRGIAEQQVDQGALLWLLRERAVRGRRLRLPEIGGFDGRLDSHLEGLRLAGREVWALCREPLAHPSRGELFLAASVAFRLGEPAFVDECFAAAAAKVAAKAAAADPLVDELASALAWVLGGATCDGATSDRAAWDALATSRCAFERLVAVSAAAAARDPRVTGAPLARALADADARVRARAVRAAGELGRVDVRDVLTAHLDDEPAVAAWAAWSLTLLGDRRGRPYAVLCRAIEEGRATDPRLVGTAVLAGKPARAAGWVATLPGVAAVHGHTALGTAGAAAWLLGHLDDPAFGRLAADGFHAITGAEPAPPASGGRDVAHDPDPDDAPVDAEPLRAWWAASGPRMPGGPLAAGHVLDAGVAHALLRTARQGVRAVVALWLALDRPQDGVFPTAAPAFRQTAALRDLAPRDLAPRGPTPA